MDRARNNKIRKCGFDRKNIILDPGIGFGKSVYQNLYITIY
ncbi:dihydropteroate synthase [Rickettsia rickettsii]